MKTADRILAGKKWQWIKEQLDAKLPSAQTESIWKAAESRLVDYLAAYADIPKGEHTHTDGRIFPAAAIYLSMKESIGKEDAMEMMDLYSIHQTEGMSATLSKIMSVPGMRDVFMKLWDPLTKKMFGPSCGFTNRFYEKKKGEYRMDVLSCPYDKYLTELGCPEITNVFCTGDDRMYGDLPGLEFIRTQTIGRGGECCDFCLRKRTTLYPGSYESKIRAWLEKRYGEQQAKLIWDKTITKYMDYISESPDYGGMKNGHSMSIYGGMLVFALLTALPDQPAFEELQKFTQELFMGPFIKLGKIFNLNRSRDMFLMDKVFRNVAGRDGKDSLKWPCGFHTVYDGFDKSKQTTGYHFTQCPVAEFAKKHDMLHYLPLMCNCDFFGIEQIHGQLIREGTCGIADRCDYLIVGNTNPIAAEYETVTDEKGFLVSRRIKR